MTLHGLCFYLKQLALSAINLKMEEQCQVWGSSTSLNFVFFILESHIKLNRVNLLACVTLSIQVIKAATCHFHRMLWNTSCEACATANYGNANKVEMPRPQGESELLPVIYNLPHFSHGFAEHCHTQNRFVTSTLNVRKNIWQLAWLSVTHLLKKPCLFLLCGAPIFPQWPNAFPDQPFCYLTANFWSLFPWRLGWSRHLSYETLG